MHDKDFYLDRFRFAAITINRWIREYGKDRAEKMVKESLLSDDNWTEYASAAFETAFGG